MLTKPKSSSDSERAVRYRIQNPRISTLEYKNGYAKVEHHFFVMPGGHTEMVSTGVTLDIPGGIFVDVLMEYNPYFELAEKKTLRGESAKLDVYVKNKAESRTILVGSFELLLTPREILDIPFQEVKSLTPVKFPYAMEAVKPYHDPKSYSPPVGLEPFPSPFDPKPLPPPFNLKPYSSPFGPKLHSPLFDMIESPRSFGSIYVSPEEAVGFTDLSGEEHEYNKARKIVEDYAKRKPKREKREREEEKEVPEKIKLLCTRN